LIEDLLKLSRVRGWNSGAKKSISAPWFARRPICAGRTVPARNRASDSEDGVTAWGDANLLRIALTNLLETPGSLPPERFAPD
jgi:hypothetical protein